MPLRVIGIRPGEKLHEVMITEDDHRWTYELPDRYVILSNTARADEKIIPSGAVSVPEGFRYGSNTNTESLDDTALLSMLTAKGP